MPLNSFLPPSSTLPSQSRRPLSAATHVLISITPPFQGKNSSIWSPDPILCHFLGGLRLSAISPFLLCVSQVVSLLYTKWKWGLVTQSCLTLSWFPWTVAYQIPLSMEFTRQEHWSGFPSPSPGYIPDSGIELRSPELQAILYYQLSHQECCLEAS